MISDFRCLVKSPSWPEFLQQSQKFKRPQKSGDHGSGEKRLQVQKSRSCCEQWFSKGGAEICVQDRNHSSDPVARQN